MYEEIDAYLQRLIRDSRPDRPLWNLEQIRQGKPARWNYIDGCMMTALLSVAEITGDKQYSDFAERFIDYYIGEDGAMLGYEQRQFQLDDINEGRVLFDLYEMTGKEKYRKAIGYLREQLREQPRTSTGNFWHKAIYPHQIWLDGIYMAHVFYVRYNLLFGDGDVSDSVRQIRNVRKLMFDEQKHLLYHGLDCSKSAFWADPGTGRSANFWLRAIGWFLVALADLMEYLTDADARAEIGAIFREVIAGIQPYADPETGMYYQVVDCGRKPGNYLESSGSSMVAYAMLKGARLGVLDAAYAQQGKKTFDGICSRYLTQHPDGTLHLGGICLVAGLGPENNRRRDGSYAYYISEPVVENDAKGVAPFLLCYTEIKRMLQ